MIGTIEGRAVTYDEPLWHNNHWVMVIRGAFNKSLRNDKIHFCLRHDQGKFVGSTDRHLVLTSSADCLSFCFYIPHSELGFETRSWVQSKRWLGMSIGFDYVNARRESRTIGLKTVETIIEARLQEISLVPEGACKSAYAQLTNSTEFADASDEAADAMMRAFQKLRDAA